MVFEKLKAILAEQLDIDENSITADSLLVEDLGADSLDAIDIVMSVEDEFKIEVPDEIIEKIESVGDILNYVENNI
ncbi:MAG: acyl carrier protein [Eubacteriales bacterium]|nr:acyl carrier protein [Eubacteriales bacterium]